MEKFLIFDGNSVVNRAFYAVKNLTAPDGLPTGGIFGFLNVLFKNIEDEKPQYIAVAFDVHAPTFRHQEYDLYKAQRQGMPTELAEQMPYLKQVLKSMNIKMLELAGYEADDIIGTVSEVCKNRGINCRIVTGDKDDLQLVGDNTEVLLTTTAKGITSTEVYSAAEVVARYGVEPLKLIDIKGLMGDASDNIPGVPGVGEVTAKKLIAQYGTLENLYDNIDSGDIKGALLEKLKNGQESAFLSRKLATIIRNVPIELNISECTLKDYNNDELYDILSRLGFKSMIMKLGIEKEKTKMPEIKHKNVVDFDALIKRISDDGNFCYMNINDEFYISLDDEVYKTLYDEKLAEVFESEKIRKISLGVKDTIVYLNKEGSGVCGELFDVGLAAYVLNPSTGRYKFSEIAEDYLGISADEQSGTTLLLKLYNLLNEKLTEQGLGELYYDIESPLMSVLAKMQIYGFGADRGKLEEFSLELDKQIKLCEQTIYFLAGEEFNINSPKQLGVVLFERLGLPVVKKTKSGYSTDVDVLNKLQNKHEIVSHIIDYRHLAKLKSTYADGLLAVLNEKTGRIHSSFNQTVTATGRISSTEPNLQNIPIKLEMGREVRKVFVADEDYILVDADYSQIELRVLAHISDDEKMKEAFLNDVDIHTQTASQVFSVAEFMVTPQMRSSAKAVNFGIVYGMSDFSLAQDIGVTRKEAKAYIENYLKTYSGVAGFMKSSVEFAKENGYVKTIFGRRRYIPELKSSNFNIRSFGERVAMNAPIQGSAADIIKIAMINVDRALKERAPRSRLILQVHDELIVEAHKDEVETVKEILKEKMEDAFSLSVPLKIDMNCGKSWFDTK